MKNDAIVKLSRLVMFDLGERRPMKTSARATLSTIAAVVLGLAATSPVHALPVISNGGFEAGLTSWTKADQIGSEGTFSSQSGTLSPVNGDVVPAPPEGTKAAMTDAEGPGSHVLYQDFVATAGSAALSFALFIGNRATDFFTPASLDFSTPTLNQQARVDILKSTADPFSVAAADVLLNLYQTNIGDPLISGYNTITTDITALLAAHPLETLRLRFAETDNVFTFQLGVDNVRFDPIPEPSSILLFGAALALFVGWRGRRLLSAHRCTAVVVVLGAAVSYHVPARADTTPLTVLDPNLQVTTVLNAGITQPIGIVFLGLNDYLVLEKASGQIKRVINGVIQSIPVLDLAVNSNSERGLLSMVLHPNFPAMPFAYVRWTESSTGADSGVVSEVPLTGNQVDRFIWNGTTLTFDRNLIMLRSRQTDNVAVPGHPGTTNPNENGNHNGGVLRFGPDGKLYLYMGDQGRRGWMQNLPNGPFLTAPFVDDTFGGPMPDNAHLSGIILRLNDDGTAPTDNPFFAAGAAMGGEVGANIQKVYSYGHRNSFGMAFDPYLGSLWLTENADDAYSELNRVIPGMNGGWVQLAGPLSRISDWKFIETTQFGSALQQVRYPPTRAAYTAALALSRMFMLPGATYVDPDFSWRYEIGPAGTTFVKGAALGAEYDGTLWMGSARSFQQVANNGGSLYHFSLTTDRLHVDVSADPRLADRVADNLFSPTKFEGTESETLQIGKGFGTTPSIEQGPDGNLYVVSVTDNAIYKISRRP
jgi:glucose/arabinose dehydrogenase